MLYSEAVGKLYSFIFFNYTLKHLKVHFTVFTMFHFTFHFNFRLSVAALGLRGVNVSG